jgi:hypothetical protein
MFDKLKEFIKFHNTPKGEIPSFKNKWFNIMLDDQQKYRKHLQILEGYMEYYNKTSFKNIITLRGDILNEINDQYWMNYGRYDLDDAAIDLFDMNIMRFQMQTDRELKPERFTGYEGVIYCFVNDIRTTKKVIPLITYNPNINRSQEPTKGIIVLSTGDKIYLEPEKDLQKTTESKNKKRFDDLIEEQ